MEALVARTRLGHTWWTFPSRPPITKAARAMEARGMVTIMHGVTERTFRVGLTPGGLASYGEADYVAPILGGPK